ncbi:MAG: hypothetical protein ABEJ57_03160 [Halobacteriaceae archaeon]
MTATPTTPRPTSLSRPRPRGGAPVGELIDTDAAITTEDRTENRLT